MARQLFLLESETQTFIAHLGGRFLVQLSGIQAKGYPETFRPLKLTLVDQIGGGKELVEHVVEDQSIEGSIVNAQLAPVDESFGPPRIGLGSGQSR